MNITTTIAPCATGAQHGDSPARLRVCVTIADTPCCAGCLRLVAGVLDATDAGFQLAAPDAGQRDDYAEMMSDTGHEVQ